MPMKRRKLDSEATGSKEKAKEDDENDSQEHRSLWSSKKKRNFANAFIVISDSDGETAKEKMEEQRRKTKSVLSKLEAKRRIAQMTEEEQLELAVRMSEQEASQATYQREEENELLKKAITESLNRKSSPKGTRRRRAATKLTRKEHEQPSLQGEDEDSGASVATCPDSLPPSQPSSPVPGSKPTLKPVSDNSCMSSLRSLNSASEPGSCSLSPTRRPASQSRVGTCSASAVSTPASKLLDGTSIPSPVNKSISRLQDGVSGTSRTCDSDSQPLSGASSSSPMTKSTSQPLSGVGFLTSPIKRGSPAAGGASCFSTPARKSASQPLAGAGCSSPINRSASQPLDDRQSCSPVSASVPDNMDMGAKSPVVMLERLSQDVLESPSVILSPAGKVTCSDLSQNPASPALTDFSDFVPTTPLKLQFARSPTFPKVSPCIRQIAPRSLMSSLAKHEGAVDEDLEKVPSDCDESAMFESTSGSSTPDNVMDLQDEGILGQRSIRQTQGTGVTGTNGHRRMKETPALHQLLKGASQEPCTKLEDKGTVHYYWGVPFCPKGGNPNLYTKVILAQLEVYQKSLKQAQRQLLQKREHGPPILPIPPSLRRSNRSRVGEKDEISEENAWDNQSSQEDPMSDKSRESSPAPVEHTTPADDGPTTSYMQASGRGSTRGYAQDTGSATDMQKKERGTMNRNEIMAMVSKVKASNECTMQDRKQTQCTEEMPNGSATDGDVIDGEPVEDSPSVSDLSGGGVQETPGAAGTPEQKEEAVTVCPETQASLSSETEPDRSALPVSGSDSPIQSARGVNPEEIKSNDPTRVDMQPTMTEDPSTMADLESSLLQVTSNMDEIQCPLCGLEFASEQIERHAADCNGSAEQKVKRQESPVLTRRRRGIKSTTLDVEDFLSSPDTGKSKSLAANSPVLHFPGLGKCEKCYVCKELVPLRLYQEHVDSCLQTAVLETQGSRRLRSTKEVGRSEGRLLSMLDHSENMSADAERRTSAPRPGPLRSHEANKDDEIEGYSLKEPSSPDDFTSHMRFSNSPIKSFVSISEATDCLVDFKKQFTKAPGPGRGRGLSRGSGKRSRWRGKKR